MNNDFPKDKYDILYVAILQHNDILIAISSKLTDVYKKLIEIEQEIKKWQRN